MHISYYLLCPRVGAQCMHGHLHVHGDVRVRACHNPIAQVCSPVRTHKDTLQAQGTRRLDQAQGTRRLDQAQGTRTHKGTRQARGFCHLAEYLSGNNSLQRLSIGDNSIGEVCRP